MQKLWKKVVARYSNVALIDIFLMLHLKKFLKKIVIERMILAKTANETAFFPFLLSLTYK